MSMEGKWGYSTDEETYHGAYGTSEEAIEEGKAEGYESFFIGQYREPGPPLWESFSISDLIEKHLGYEDFMMECADMAYDRDWKKIDPEIDETVRSLIEAWCNRHGVEPGFGVVEPDTVNEIIVPGNKKTPPKNTIGHAR